MRNYATYLRVSTQRQGEQGLGISAQRTMCDNFIKQNNGQHVQEFMDVESGTHRDRKGLWQAIDYCKRNDCGLVIAKLDRLARDVEFTFKIMNTGIDIHFTDMPVVNSMVLGVFAAVAQYERELISDRTKKALSVKKAQGAKLGAASEVYKLNYENKSKEEKAINNMKRGRVKNERHLESRDVHVFLKVLKRVFPHVCVGDDPRGWNWNLFTTRGDYKDKIKYAMQDYKEMDENNKLFRKWDFDSWDDKKTQIRIAAEILNLKRSIFNNVAN